MIKTILGTSSCRVQNSKVIFGFSRFKLARLLSQRVCTTTDVFLVLHSLVNTIVAVRNLKLVHYLFSNINFCMSVAF